MTDEADGALALRPTSHPEPPPPPPPMPLFDSPASSIGTPEELPDAVPEEPEVPDASGAPEEQPGTGAWVQPAVAEHVSLVHASPSSQLSQLVQALAPGAGAYVPEGQAVQAVSADAEHAAAAYVPGSQTVHALHVPPSRKKPLGHVPQSDALGPEHVVQLGSHAAQTVSAVPVHAADGYVPGAQALHVLQAPPERYLPAAQLVQAAGPAPVHVAQEESHAVQTVFDVAVHAAAR